MRCAFFAFFAFLLTVCCVAAVAGDAYDPTDPRRVRSGDPTELPAGWIYNPDDSAVLRRDPRTNEVVEVLVPRRYWKWNGDNTAVIPMTQSERDALDQARDRKVAFSQAADAELRLVGLSALRDRLAAADKNTTLIDARIAQLDAALSNAVERLP